MRDIINIYSYIENLSSHENGAQRHTKTYYPRHFTPIISINFPADQVTFNPFQGFFFINIPIWPSVKGLPVIRSVSSLEPTSVIRLFSERWNIGCFDINFSKLLFIYIFQYLYIYISQSDYEISHFVKCLIISVKGDRPLLRTWFFIYGPILTKFAQHM